jgi:hypothetical protein
VATEDDPTVTTEDDDLMDKTKVELQDMAEELGLPTSGTKEELVERIEEAQTAPESEETGPTGATQTPVQEHAGDIAARPVEPETLSEAGEPQANPNTYDDGVEDVELGPPVVGQFVFIHSGEYDHRYAVYLGDVGVIPDDEAEKVIQVRTRDADNLLIDVPYSDVSSTTYSGGR